jgi:dTDP-4-dehydrorhamnose reductase
MIGPVLITGAGGQVGRALQRVAQRAEVSVIACGRSVLDVTRPQQVRSVLARWRPTLVINAAAFTGVDAAEQEAAKAYAINAQGAGSLAQVCGEFGLPLIHLSTDYVFSGILGRPYREDDETGAINVYGDSKARGEALVIAATERHVILRTAWVFSAEGSNFVRSILQAAEREAELQVVSDQYGSPTGAEDVASAILAIVQQIARGAAPWGTFHLAGGPSVSRQEFASAILAMAGRRNTVRAIASADYPTAAMRPQDTALDCTKVMATFGLPQPDWRVSLRETLHRLRTQAAA